MNSDRTSHDKDEPTKPPYRGLDPLESIRREAPSFNQMWLKDGESLLMIQRVGFTIFSLAFFACGIFLVNGAILSFREGSAVCIFMAVPSPFLLIFGLLGLRNILRFKPRDESTRG
jgi:hypothetical protein